MRRGLIAIAGLIGVLGLGATPAQAADTDWLELRTLNIAHQGGETEAPSNTMYAYRRSMLLGSDMLEVDIHATADGRVIAIHDGSVERTTNGSGSIYDMSLRAVRRLDAAYNFVPGVGTSDDAPRGSYPFRGVRTGKGPPPGGFLRRDFRIPTLGEVMRRYPEVPINIEIKGRSDSDQASYNRNADRLAGTLERIGRTEGIIVASFNDAALARFHERMPEIDLAPALAETAAFKLGGAPPGPGKVAFQVPITFEGIQVTDREFVRDSHAAGLAVHVWLSNDPENQTIYRRLLGWNVDGIMAAEPTELERRLCADDVARPPRPASFPGAHCRHRRVSIACRVVPRRISKLGGRGGLRVVLRRRDDFTGHCAGRLRVRAAGHTALGRFDFGRRPPSEGGPARRTVRLKLPPRVRRAVRRREINAKVRTRAYQAYGGFARYRLRPR